MKTFPVPLPVFSVQNRQRKMPVDGRALEQFGRQVLPPCAREGGSGLTSLAEVNVLLVSDRRIAQLHQRFMGIAGPTDVITFQHGEIFISVETARRQAQAHGTSFAYELRLYLVHGLLHLQGFDDSTPPARARMQAVQEKILARTATRLGEG